MGNNQPSARKKTYYISLAILAGMFFIFGFVSWVNSILIPYFRISCELTHFESYFVAFAFYIAYFVMAIPSGILLKKVGFKKGIMYGFMLTALGAFIFVPAALARQFEIFLIGLFSIGTGLAILQTAANPYVTIIGPIDSAARRISIMGICNKVAGIISPLIFAALILKANDSELFALIESGALDEATKNAMLNELIQRVIIPYIILGIILLLTGIGIRYSVLPEINTDEQNATDEQDNKHTDKKSILDFPYLILGALAIFFHVGTQVIAIDTIINYANSMGMDLLEAKVFPSYTLGCTMIGYILGIILIPKYISRFGSLIRSGMGRLRYHIIRSSSQCFHLLSECFRFSQRSDLCRNMASFHSWVRQIHQNRFLSADYGIMRQCHLTFGIWSLCRPVQFAYRLLGTYSLLYLSGILCHQRA